MNGNVLTDGFHTYSWDAAGKTTQVDPGASVVGMTYDALGRWVERAAGGGFTQAVYAPDGHELALMSGQTVATAYVKLPAGALVRYESGGLDSYWHPDWLGTPRLYSKPARTIANDVALGPFGEWYPGQGADTFFTGVGQNVMAIDVKAFPARSYHTTQGRWLSPDPAGLAAVDITNPQSLNRYAYVGGDPLGNVDPDGLDWTQVPVQTCVAVSSTISYATVFGGYTDLPTVTCTTSTQVVWRPDANPGAPASTGTQGPVSNIPAQPAKNVVRNGNYPNLDCDGYRAAKSILPQTTKRGIEFGGFLYTNSNGKYSYSNPVSGTQTSVPALFSSPQALIAGIVGWFHSHPLVPGYNNDLFSGNDLLITRYLKGPGYLATASGNILKLNLDPKGHAVVSIVGSGSCQAN